MNESKSVKHWIEYFSLACFIKIFTWLPERAAYHLGEKLGWLFFWVDRRHRRMAMDNLRIAFGQEANQEKLMSIALKSYIHLGRSLAELARTMISPPEKIIESVNIHGWDHFMEAHKKGKGVIYLAAHLGNWEMMAMVQSLKGYPISVVARPMDNPLLEDLLSRLRTRWGNRVISKGGAVREVLRILKAGGTTGFLLDQNVAPEQGVFVNFFGRPACTHKTLALLALRTGAAVLPAFIFRDDEGRHQIVIEPPVALERTEDGEKDIITNTQNFTAVIESFVNKHPDQWLWVHRRWESQPK